MALRTFALLLGVALQLEACCCDPPPPPPAIVRGCHPSPCQPSADGQGQELVGLWIGADKDAFVSFGRQGSEQDMSFPCRELATAAMTPQGHARRSYVHFSLPILPEGSEIVRAKLELYHDARQEDGHSDDIVLGVHAFDLAWSPFTLTWRNQPIAVSTAGSPLLRLRSQSWSGTPDITAHVKPILVGTKSTISFMISQADPAYKGFDADNHRGRTAQDLAHSPRLLLLVQLPPGTSTQDIRLQALPAENDLGDVCDSGGAILMVRYANGGFPASWEVTPG